MDALVAKATVLDASKKRKRFHSNNNKKVSGRHDGTLASIATHTGLPRSLASATTESNPTPSHKHIKDKKKKKKAPLSKFHPKSAIANLTKSLNAEVEDPLFADPDAPEEGAGIQV